MSFIGASTYVRFKNAHQELIDISNELKLVIDEPMINYYRLVCHCGLAIEHHSKSYFEVRKFTHSTFDSLKRCHDVFDISSELMKKYAKCCVRVIVDIPICVANDKKIKRSLRKYTKMIEQMSLCGKRTQYSVDYKNILHLKLEFKIEAEMLRKVYDILEKIYQDPRIVAEVI